TACKVTTIAGRAGALAHVAGQWRTDTDRLDPGLFDDVDILFVQQMTLWSDQIASQRMEDIVGSRTAQHTLADGSHNLAGIHDGSHGQATLGAAILRHDDRILRHVDKTTRQVTRVRGLQRRIRQTLTGTVGGVEVFENVEALLEVGRDRGLDDRAVRTGHQATHAGKLLHLGRRTAGTRVRHHIDRVDRLLTAGFLVDLHLADRVHHLFGDLVTALGPGVDHLVVLFALSDQAVIVLLFELFDLLTSRFHDGVLGSRDNHVVLTERNARITCVLETELHDAVAEDHGLLLTAATVNRVDHLGDHLLGHQLVCRREWHRSVLGQDLPDQHAARGRFHDLGGLVAVLVERGHAAFDLAVQRDDLVVERMLEFGIGTERHAFAGLFLVHEREIVETQDDILRRHDDRLAVGRVQDVVGRHHQHARFQLRFERQRNVHSHLVTVEVGVEGRADERVQTDGLAFDEDRLERLDTKTVQRRRTVQQNRVLADDFVKDIPDFGLFLLDQLLGLLDRGRQALGFEARVDEGLEELKRHLLGQAALVQLEVRTHGDNRTTRIVDALAEQVLTEAALLALEHVGQRLQRTLVGTGDGAATAPVVEQGVNSFLQHALFVADNDIRRTQLDEALQAVVAVDHATVEVVEIGGRKAAAIQRNQRTQ